MLKEQGKCAEAISFLPDKMTDSNALGLATIRRFEVVGEMQALEDGSSCEEAVHWLRIDCT